MNKSESKYFNTALLMNRAFLEVLEKKDFEYISVKEICERAGVNRSTFYLHYETMADLLDECLENASHEFNESFSVKESDFLAQIDKMPLDKLMLIDSSYLIPYLLFVKKNRALYKAFYMNRECLQTSERMEHMSDKVLYPILSRFGIPKEEQKFVIRFFVNGCHAIIKEWILEDCRTSVEEIEKIIIHCIRPMVEGRE